MPASSSSKAEGSGLSSVSSKVNGRNMAAAKAEKEQEENCSKSKVNELTTNDKCPQSPELEHPPIEWEKPSWTNAKLKSTDQGASVKKGIDLQSPITHIRKKVIINEETGEELELSSSSRHTPSWAKPSLKNTEKGQAVKEGADLQAPITLGPGSNHERKAGEWEKPDWTTEPKLKNTPYGQRAKSLGNLANPITHIDSTLKGELLDETDPDWVNNPPLKPTPYGERAKSIGNLANPITHIDSMKDELLDEADPDWVTTNKLRNTPYGERAKSVGNLQKAITHIEKDESRDINYEANPMLLKPTEKGSSVRLGENLARPITHIAKDPSVHVNSEANPDELLRETQVGQAVKQGSDLQNPITFPSKNEEKDINKEADPTALKNTQRGSMIRDGAEIQRSITFPRGKGETAKAGEEIKQEASS